MNSNNEKTLVIEHARELLGAAPTEREAMLTILLGGDVGAVHPVKGTMVIGRDARADLSLADDALSRNHCRILRAGDDYLLEDLGSTNGTFVDDIRVAPSTKLVHGARIRIGNTILRFALQDRLDQETSRQVYELAVRDGLTGTYNRRYFDERIHSEFAFTSRHGTALAVLLIDVDHFKRINDTFGHQAGDEVLRRLATCLRTSARIEDVVARYGGEEFAVIVRGIDVDGTLALAERLRALIEDLWIEWEGARIAVTASIGIAHSHVGTLPPSPEHFVADADRALYSAKRQRRNCVELADSPAPYHGQQIERGRARRRIWEIPTAGTSSKAETAAG